MSAKNDEQTLDKNETVETYPLSFGNGDWDSNYDLKLVQYALEPPDSPQPVSEFLKRRSHENDSNNSTPKNIFNDSFCDDNSLEGDNYPSSPEQNSNSNDQTDANILPPTTQQIFQTPLQKPTDNDRQEPFRNSLFSAIKFKALHYKTPTKDSENNPVKGSIMSSLQKNDNILLTQQRILSSNRFNAYSTPSNSKPSSGLQQTRKGLNFKDFNTKIKDNIENHLDSIQEIEYSPKKEKTKILTDMSNDKIDDDNKKSSLWKQSENYRKNSVENENIGPIGSKLDKKTLTSTNNEDDLQKFQQRIDTKLESLNSQQNSMKLNEISKKTTQSEAIINSCGKNYFNELKNCGNNISDKKHESLIKFEPNLNELSKKKVSSQNELMSKPSIKNDNHFDKKHEFSNSEQNIRQFEPSLIEVPSKKLSLQNEVGLKVKSDLHFNEAQIDQNNQFDKKHELSNSHQNAWQIEASMNEVPPIKALSQNEIGPKCIKSNSYNSNYSNGPKASQNNQFDKQPEFSNSQQNSRQVEVNMNEVTTNKKSPQKDRMPKSTVIESRSCRNYPKQEESNCNKNYKSNDEFKKPDVKINCISQKASIQNSKNIQPGNSHSQINDKRPLPISNMTPSYKKPEQLNNNAKSSIQFPLLSTIKPTLVGRTLQIQNVEYLIKSKLGEGGSCEVYEGTNVENSRNFAIKCVNLAVDPITAKGYMSEIQLLAKLQSSDYVIKMFAYEKIQDKLYVIMERGEMDLGQLIENSKNLHIAMIVYYWIEMLTAVKCIHDNGVIHSDLKPANFLMVKGRLKLIDFGIASVVHDDCTSIIKNTQAGTLNYISPEALIDTRDFSSTNSDMNINISYKSDVWSLGCILYKFLYGKTPFQHITNKMAKFIALTDKNHIIDYPNTIKIPPKLLTVLKKCLIFEMRKRPSVDELLKVNYICFNNCD